MAPLDAPSCPFCREPLTDALDALLLALREAIAPALAAGLTGCDPGPLTPSEGAAYDRGVEDGRVRGRAAMAADVAALLDAAARPGADGEEAGHG